ncbi:MAG: hypothetical protein ABFC96_09425 [Thermoguttaceae bacterium]
MKTGVFDATNGRGCVPMGRWLLVAPTRFGQGVSVKTQVVVPSRKKNRRQPLAAAGEKRRRWESDPRWRICNQTARPGLPEENTDFPEAGGIFGGSETGDGAPDPDLRLILDGWAALPEPIRAGIVAMVKAAGG